VEINFRGKRRRKSKIIPLIEKNYHLQLRFKKQKYKILKVTSDEFHFFNYYFVLKQ